MDDGSEIRLSEEHKTFRWLLKEEAISLLVWPGQKEAIRSVCDFIIQENPGGKLMEIPFIKIKKVKKLKPKSKRKKR